MKTWRTIVLGLFFLLACSKSNVSPLGNWVKKSDFEGLPRGAAVSFVINNMAYLGLGYNSDLTISNTDFDINGFLKDFWRYDPSMDRWYRIANFPGNARNAAVAFSVNGKGYVGTGYDGNNKLKDFWEYDPTSNTWTQKDDFIGGGRYSAVGFSLNNFGYVGTGYGDDLVDKVDFYRFDPTAAAGSQWVKVQSIGSKRRSATAFTYNNKAYVCSGFNNGVFLTDMWEYDPTADNWTKKVALDSNSAWTIVRQNASSFVMGDKGYVFLGEKSAALSDVWEYNFVADTWTQKTNFEGAARTNAVAFVVSGKGIVATGQSASYYLDDVYEFQPFAAYNKND